MVWGLGCVLLAQQAITGVGAVLLTRTAIRTCEPGTTCIPTSAVQRRLAASRFQELTVYYTILYNIILYNTILYYIILYYTILYYMKIWLFNIRPRLCQQTTELSLLLPRMELHSPRLPLQGSAGPLLTIRRFHTFDRPRHTFNEAIRAANQNQAASVRQRHDSTWGRFSGQL